MSTRMGWFWCGRGSRGLTIAVGLVLAAFVHEDARAASAKNVAPVSVVLDVAPGDSTNHVVLEGRGSIAVAILAGEAYDVTAIDPSTLALSGAAVNKERIAFADVDGDGRQDLVFRVRRTLLRVPDEARTLTLRGAFRDGRPLVGTAPIVGESATLPDPVQEKLPVVPVAIDVLPGEGPSLVDRAAKGDLVVAVFGSVTFDVAKVDPATLDLAGAPVGRDEDDDPRVTSADLDGDGRADLLVSFPRRLMRVDSGLATVELRGAVAGGRGFAGSDTVVIQGPAPSPAPLSPASTASFTNAAPITIPAGAPASSSGPASPYPSNIVVSGLPGFVQFVSVTLNGLTHTFPDDLDVLLVGPGGQNVILMSDVGGSTDVTGATLTIADSGVSPLPDEGALATGVYRPNNVGGGDVFPSPAPAPSPATAMFAFNGSEPNGTWSLYVLDDNAVDFGSVAGGWTLTIGTSLTQVCNPAPVTIPGEGSAGPASPYPSTISVSGVLGTVTHAVVSLRQLFHSYPDDIDLLLTGPGGGNALVMSDAGGSTSTVADITLNLDDAAPIPVPDESPLQQGTFRPANYDLGPDLFPAPAPVSSGNTALSVFNGQNPNGAWSLYAVDDAIQDGGGLQSGWCLTLTTTSCAGRAPCNDNNPCTDDVCDAATGRCTFVADDTNACTDGNACTVDACVAGACVSTPGSGAFRFSSAAPIVIPAGAPGTTSGPAAPYPAAITVPPLGGSVSRLTVTLDGFAHTFPDDVDVLLVAPGGANLVLMSDVGLDSDVSGLTLAFSDDAPSSLPDAEPLVSGSYRPTNFGAGDTFPAPAPVPWGSTDMSVFQGANPAGDWKLYIVDDATQETGVISGGWSMTIVVDCDDGDVCTDDLCDPTSGCVHVNNTAPCDNHDVCDGPDQCRDGACLPNGLPTCYSDGNPCTDDRCDPVIGCIFTPNTEPCNDNDPCTVGDRCGEGICHPGAPADCSDGNDCTDDACGPSGQCTHVNNTNPCDDHNVCFAGDQCVDGVCQSGGIATCYDDANPCTDDRCDPKVGCVFTNNTEPCDDHDPCTVGDRCGSGVCQPGAPADCSDGNACTDDACGPSGQCTHVDNVAPCEDGNRCTTNDACAGGTCHGGGATDCSDGNPCTDDACSPSSGCGHVDNHAPCSDGNACTTGDACAGGVCHPGTSSVCDDGNVCTDDACDPAGGCVFTSNNSCNTKGNGYWKQLCRGPHSGDALTSYDVDCVNDSCTFASVQSIAGLCDRLDPAPPNDKCEQAEADFMGLLLNLCRRRVTPVQSIDSRCGPHQTVDASRAAADAALCDPARDFDACQHADCAATEIAEGSALGANSLRVRREGNGVRLSWEPPYVASDSLVVPHRFRIYRRPAASAPAVQIGEVSPGALTFLDAGAATGSATYVYEVVTVW